MTRVSEAGRRVAMDTVLGEEPLTIQARHLGQVQTVTTTLRTPGDDFSLAVGLLVSEGFCTGEAIRDVRYCLHEGLQEYNTVTVDLRSPIDAPPESLRTSSCGWCGVQDLTSKVTQDRPQRTIEPRTPTQIFQALKSLADQQRLFIDTGSAHAAGIVGSDAEMLLREDVGRHNALDKAIGASILAKRSLVGSMVVLSGRAGVDLVAKAARVGADFIVSVSAPTTLAISLAAGAGVCLIGFARDSRFTVYTHPQGVLDPNESYEASRNFR
ncbi:MAG: formate dehydrogenase accessory sulfurtransferase FdhD [Ferrimicrobium sp.]